jgi:ferrous iron transport protein A
MPTLSDMHRGDRGVVTGFSHAATRYRAKLLSMGLTPGAELAVVRYAPMGDPIEIEIRGYRLSLRRQEANVIEVDLVKNAVSEGASV